MHLQWIMIKFLELEHVYTCTWIYLYYNLIHKTENGIIYEMCYQIRLLKCKWYRNCTENNYTFLKWFFFVGVSSFAQSSYTTAQPEENFEFKDNSDLYNDDYLTRQPVGTLPASAMYDESMMQKNPEISSRYSFVDPRITHANAISDRSILH